MEDFNSKYTGEEVEEILDSVGGKQDKITDLEDIRSGAEKGATAVQAEDVLGIVNEEGFVTAEDLAKVATSGSYNDLQDKPTIPSAINIAGTNYTPSGSGIIDLNPASLYRKPSDGIPKNDLSSEVQTALTNANTYKGTVTGVKINGTTKSSSDGIVDLGNIPTSIPTEVYIADFTMESLRNGLRNGAQVQCGMQALVAALNANKVILVRESEISDYKGVHVLNGYAEDFLYFSIVDTSGGILWCEGSAYTDGYIDGRTLYLESWADKQDVLKSGENIKTINGESVVGSGDITIAGGSGEKGDKGDKGDTGVGVSSVKQTTISNTDGGSNVVTVTLTNGTTSTFTVKNGSKGSSGNNGTNGKDGADGATFTPSVDSAGNLSWTNNKGLTNPPTVNIKGPKGDKGDAGESGDGSGGGPTVEFLDYQGLINIEDNKVYQIVFPVTELTIDIVSNLYIGSVLRFKTEFEGCTLTMPDNVYWANGIIPDIEGNTCYELSLTSIDILTILAVLTPFKYV